MGKAAVDVARACNYEGAGTVEFLLDDQMNFYFLEMNTRLQVEHPVTELITGVDLVEQQIRIARGEELSFGQDDLSIQGHALELRVYAEDPQNDFLPSIGTLTTYERPEGENIRVDDGYYEGMEIPIYYDPMIAKLITYSHDRQGAIDLMKKAIAHYKIEGIETTLPFGAFVCRHDDFISGNFDTHFVKKNFSSEEVQNLEANETRIAAIFAVKNYLNNQKKLKTIEHRTSNWSTKRIH